VSARRPGPRRFISRWAPAFGLIALAACGRSDGPGGASSPAGQTEGGAAPTTLTMLVSVDDV
jgi:hypothetical protein